MNMNQKRINLAIRNCLKLCYASKNVLATVAAFLAGMRIAGVWRDDEIHAVEIGVHRLLQRIMVGSRAAQEMPPAVARPGLETTNLTGA